MKARRVLGLALVLPLAAALIGSVVVGASCGADCGDQGGRGMFILVLLCTPPAAAGVLALARSMQPGRLARRAVLIPVVGCALLLAGTAIAAIAGGVDRLTGEPENQYVGDPEAGREQATEEGIFLLVVGGVLGVMATGTGLALRAALSKRR